MCGVFASSALYNVSADNELQRYTTDDPAGDIKFSLKKKDMWRSRETEGRAPSLCSCFCYRKTQETSFLNISVNSQTENRSERPFKGRGKVCVLN